MRTVTFLLFLSILPATASAPTDYVLVFDKACFELVPTERSYVSYELNDKGEPDMKIPTLHHFLVTTKTDCGRYVRVRDLK